MRSSATSRRSPWPICPGVEGVDLRLTAWDLPPVEADQRLQQAAGLLRARAAGFAYGEGELDLAAVVLARARAAKLRLGTAESCTGGLVGGRLTEIPGQLGCVRRAVWSATPTS